MTGITATIITLNEAATIAGCIASLQGVCDQVIVVDSLSTDDTVAIAKAHGAEVYLQEYLGDGPQKAFGVQYAKFDWILSIDADERLDIDAQQQIPILAFSKACDGYAIKRKNFVGSHWIRAAGFYPDYVIRLYNKHTAAYLPQKKHARVKAKRIKQLDCHMLHYTYENYSHWIMRINWLSSHDAWALKSTGKKKPSPLAPLRHGAYAFIKKLIFKGGIFQGIDGTTVAITSAFHSYMKYAKLIELYQQQVDNPRPPK